MKIPRADCLNSFIYVCSSLFLVFLRDDNQLLISSPHGHSTIDQHYEFVSEEIVPLP